MSEHPASDGVILTHATLAALTPLVPVPFIDTALRNRVMRRMIRSLAELHHVRIWDAEVTTLADEAGGGLLKGLAKGAVLAPFKVILRKTFMVLAGKQVVDIASRTYHHGYLVEHAFAKGYCAPSGKCTPSEIRKAIDVVIAQEPVAKSPVTRALSLGYDESQRALFSLYTSLRAKVSGGSFDAIDDMGDDGGLAGVIASLTHALTAVPQEHFEDLERKLDRALFGSDGAGIIVKEVDDEPAIQVPFGSPTGTPPADEPN